ncbi:hypothetical protein P3T76_014662 [Phytophthora citrophthora]|uniref:FHA domain-containing protein n=1 Tax=Phytophthora citrophthora TaxID=4793 RepID=A0AAD9G115_9STRA|nr:hypothetical protein P3T76_014662 [Phytophthora citrophthora]
MAASPSCCFRLEASRGPHSGVVVRYCCVEAAAVSPEFAELSIGRKKRCWLRLPNDLEVSSAHAEFRFVEGGKRVAIRDSKSTNGTKLNGNPLKPHQNYQLNNGDLVGVGKTCLRFEQVVHGQLCGGKAEANITTAVGSGLMSSASLPVAKVAGVPEVIVLDADLDIDPASGLIEAAEDVPSVAGPTEAPVDQPDTEPGLDEVVLVKPAMVGAVSDVNNEKKSKGEGAKTNVDTSTEKKQRTGAVHGYTPEEATCTVCNAVIGQLDLLEQQAHLNECLGGRVVVSAQLSTKAAPKSRKRGNVDDPAPRAKKPRKPKASSEADAAPKARKPRKRKRATDAGEDIELALALTGKTKLSKEAQTDAQLAVAKKKLEQLDEQMAKLAKRRVSLVKTLDRLERTKEKLRKSQVLPPAKVLQFLDLKAALVSIFPNNRQAQPADRFVDKQLMSTVAKQYTPSRWSDTEVAIDCDNEKQVELATVAAISMWARASQQLFGLRRDTLLYRNSVLRAYFGDDEGPASSIHGDDLGDEENDDGDDGVDYEPEQKLEDKLESISSDREVPDVVKRVFLNWQRDLAFLHEQTAEELEMALEAMNEAQAQADLIDKNEKEASGLEVAALESILSPREEQRLACKYMAQVMRKLIDEKKAHPDVGDHSEEVQQDVVLSSAEDVGKLQQAADIVAARDNDAELETVRRNTQKDAAFAAEEWIESEQNVSLDANSSAEMHSIECKF